jgi:hypothetical protein
MKTLVARRPPVESKEPPAAAFLCLFVVLQACFLPLSAQSINSGTIIGTVQDPSGAIVRDAKIVLRNPVSDQYRGAFENRPH